MKPVATSAASSGEDSLLSWCSTGIHRRPVPPAQAAATRWPSQAPPRRVPDRCDRQRGNTQLHAEQSTSAIVAHHPEAKYFIAEEFVDDAAAAPPV